MLTCSKYILKKNTPENILRYDGILIKIDLPLPFLLLAKLVFYIDSFNSFTDVGHQFIWDRFSLMS